MSVDLHMILVDRIGGQYTARTVRCTFEHWLAHTYYHGPTIWDPHGRLLWEGYRMAHLLRSVSVDLHMLQMTYSLT